MAESNFVDYVKIYCRSGKGGRGSSHFRREKYIPKGGPDGGDGGRGGHVYLRGNRNYWTLLHLKYERHIMATNGESGSAKRSSGKDGEDRVIEVPCGTVVYDAETGEFICDVTEDGQQVMLLKGGRGGLGNFNFKTATNQAPRYSQPGEPALERTVILQLKLLADVGLVGFPNAGKSTLLSVVSAAKPKIANYPFTTLEPNLGIVSYRDNRSFVMADIPGIIEGASEGKGLGLRFLRHIERNSLLLFMVPAEADDIKKEYEILHNELVKYNPELLDKRRVLAITKSDMLDEELIEALSQDLPEGIPYVFISSITGLGIVELKDLLWKELNKENFHEAERIVHKNIDVSTLEFEDDDEYIFPVERTRMTRMRNTRNTGTMMKMKIQENKQIEVSRFSGLSGYRDISHFTTTRHGGVSTGTYASMNPGVYTEDDPGFIRKNLELLSNAVGISLENMVIPHQTHEDRVLAIDASFLSLNDKERKLRLEGVDALVTNVPNVCVAVSTADCVPVLLYAPDRKVVAAVHAGWRGTVLHIARKAASLMIEAYDCDPTQLVAGIGPSISQAAFEVGEEVVKAFQMAGFPMERILRRNAETQKAHIDLWETNRLQLLEAGLLSGHIEIAGICTYIRYEDYFSARRLGVKSGRILTGICLKKS